MVVARLTIVILVVLGLLTGVVFAVYPTLDLQVASFFYEAAARQGFGWIHPAMDLIRDLGPIITAAAVVPAMIVVVTKFLAPGWRSIMSRRTALFLIVSLALGPGVLVNGILKENWARPRPGMVTEFGGDYVYKPWWDPRGTCDSNCSFVSGETSAATWLSAPASLAPPQWRLVALGAVGIYTASIGLARMMVGGHFLSDVIFAGIFTGLVVWMVHGFLFRWPATRLDDAVIDKGIRRIRNAVTRLFGITVPPSQQAGQKADPTSGG